jgi:hypothetical protein
MKAERLRRTDDLALVLVIAAVTPTLDQEIALLRWPRSSLGDGYYRLDARPFPALVVAVDEVSVAEQDELLDLVGHRRMHSDGAATWLRHHRPDEKEEEIMNISLEEAMKLEGFDELYGPIYARALERLPGPLLARLMTRVPPSQRLLALDDDTLRQLPTELIDRQPPEVRDEIRRRIATH